MLPDLSQLALRNTGTWRFPSRYAWGAFWLPSVLGTYGQSSPHTEKPGSTGDSPPGCPPRRRFPARLLSGGAGSILGLSI